MRNIWLIAFALVLIVCTVLFLDAISQSMDTVEVNKTSLRSISPGAFNPGTAKHADVDPNAPGPPPPPPSVLPDSEAVDRCVVIGAPGIYHLSGNVVGAPNPAAPAGGTACIQINSTNVIFDCAGHNMTNTGSKVNTYGIMVNGSASGSVVIRNCYGISGYEAGVLLHGVSGVKVFNSRAISNSDGFRLEGASDNLLSGNIAIGNSAAGFLLASGSYDNSLEGNTAYRSGGHGFLLEGSTGNDLERNTAYLCSENGIALLSGSDNNVLANNKAYNNTGEGIHLEGSSGNDVSGIHAYNNTGDGFRLERGKDNLLSNNKAEGNGGDGFLAKDAVGLDLANSRASGNRGVGIQSLSGSSLRFLHNDVHSNPNGIYLSGCDGCTLTENSVHGNDFIGIQIQDASDTLLEENRIYGQSGTGLWLRDSDSTSLAGNHYFGNGLDLEVLGTDGVLNMTNDIFDNPAGNLQNFTNLSLDDVVSSPYTINWSGPVDLPNGRSSVSGKHVEILSEGDTVIESLSWHWTGPEEQEYDEFRLELWVFDGTWTLLNGTIDVGANALSIKGHSPSGIHSMLERENCPVIPLPTSYTMHEHFQGAPNDASQAAAGSTACVIITAPNVVFDCNGYNLTGNGSAGKSFGMLLNGSATDVEVRNCPGISGYTYGVMLQRADGNNLTNLTVHDSMCGVYMNSSSSNILEGITAFGNKNTGVHLRYSQDNSLADSVLSDNSWYGVLLAGSDGNNLSGNVLTGNGIAGARADGGQHMLLRDSTASDNTVGIQLHNSRYCEILGNEVSNNTGTNAAGIALTGSTDHTTVRDNLISGNPHGIYLSHERSGNILEPNEFSDNEEDVYVEPADDS
jgi:parallel beta-helix repeat protein